MTSFPLNSKSQQAFPKSSRLLKASDFSFQNPKRMRVRGFQLIYTTEGSGRMGISLSKKILRRAHDRNRVKRLLREGFRASTVSSLGIDVHVIGLRELAEPNFEVNLERTRACFSQLALMQS